MRVIPVIDLLDGVVVRGVGGLRDQYRPIQSTLTDSTDPLLVAEAIRDYLATDYIYVADLNAIRTGNLSRDCLVPLAEAGFKVLLDAGAFQFRQVNLLFNLGMHDIVIGLETMTDPDVLGRSVERFGAERVVFSLDLKANWPLTSDASPWASDSPTQIADKAIAQGIERMIVLDLHSIGRCSGVPTLPLCQHILNTHPHVKLITGGGIREQGDIDALQSQGLDGALVASALHAQALQRAESDG